MKRSVPAPSLPSWGSCSQLLRPQFAELLVKMLRKNLNCYTDSVDKDQDYLASSWCLGSEETCRKKGTRITCDGSYPCNTVRVSQTLFCRPMTLAVIEKSPKAFPYVIFNVISTIYKDSYLSTYTKCHVCDELRLELSVLKKIIKDFVNFYMTFQTWKAKKIVKKLFLVLECYNRFYADLM